MRQHRRLLAVLVTVAMAVAANPAQAWQREEVTISSTLASKGPFTAELLRPQGPGPFPAVVALHGCGELFNREDDLAKRETDWANRPVGAGYAVLFPDSFTARGLRQICTVHDRNIFPKDRADDVAAAVEWLAKKPYIDSKHLAVMGWSHGAMTALWTVRQGFMADAPQFKAAIAFYPGCRQIVQIEDWHPRVPLTPTTGPSQVPAAIWRAKPDEAQPRAPEAAGDLAVDNATKRLPWFAI